MRLNQFKLLFLSFSFFFYSCAEAPRVTVWVSDPKNNGMQGALINNTKGFKPYSDTNNYVCFSPDDTQALFSYCKKESSK